MKSRVKKRVIALMLCMVMVLSSGISTLAEGDAGEPETTESEVNSTTDESTVNTEADTVGATDAQSRMNTAAETEETTEEGVPTEPETADTTTQESVTDDTAVTETMENEAEAQSTEPAETENNDAATQSDAAANEVEERASWTVRNLNGYNITNSYRNLTNSYTGDIDIDWSRSSEQNAVTYDGKVNSQTVQANWWNLVKGIDCDITDDNRIWDGSRLNSYGQVDHYYHASNYLPEDTVTALGNTLYDSATWRQLNSGDNTTVHRFKGTFTITENPNDYDYTLKQVLQGDEQNRIYINDNIFIFIYPQSKEGTLTNADYMNYLAFWTGTVGGANSIFDSPKKVANFNGRNSTPAYRDVRGETPTTALGKVTNGWYCDAVTDNVGDLIYSAYNEDGCTEFVIDVFVEDFATGGGMYRLQLDQTLTTRKSISFMKVDENDLDYGVSGAKFTLESEDGKRYSSTNNNGLITINATPGTYTMKESVTPSGYEKNDKTWTVTIGQNGFTIRDNETGQLVDEKDFNGTEYYYITNKSLVTGELNFTKTKADMETPLAGAEFTLYEEDGETEVGKGTSNANGTVTISHIPVGDGYILKETKAPTGDGVTYVLSDDTWIVNVDSQGNVTMYLSTDSDQTPVSVIPNYTESEEMLKGLENSKTATSIDEANRVFEVQLNAYSTGSTTTENMSDIDVVFVLDKSPSMSQSWAGNPDRDNWLNAAVRSFLSQLVTYRNEGKLTNSRVAIVEFDFGGDLVTDSGRGGDGWIKDTNELEKLSKTYSLTTYDTNGTSMRAGLEKAYDEFYNSKNYNPSNKQIIITLTDGENTGGADWIDGSYYGNDGAALKYAEKIREKVPEITFYGIGLGISEESDSRTFMQNLIVDGSKLWFVSDSEGGDKLSEVFSGIFHSSTETDVYKNAKVIDYIDSRFQYSYTENGEWKVYTDEYIQDYQAKNDGAGIELDNGGILKYDTEKKCQYIEWTQDIGADNSTDEFTKNFYIKAKEDFIGGNMVPTNGAESGVYLNDTTIKRFPQPSVNVAPLSLELTGKEIAVYKGDSIDPVEFISELTSSLKVIELDETTKVTAGIPNGPALTEAQKEMLEAGNEVVIGQAGENEYVYPGTEDPIGYFRYTYKVEEKPAISMSEHAMTESGDNVAVYSLEVQFVPYSVAERDGLEELGADVQRPAANGGTELKLGNTATQEKLTADAEYVVDVISGEIQITKKVNKASTDERDFTFNVTKDGSDVKTITITIPAGQTEATYAGVDLKDLARGEYVVTETTTGYAVTGLVIGRKTNCYYTSNLDEETATFKLGWNVNSANVIENGAYNGDGVLGVVEYTNDRVLSDWEIVKRSESDTNTYLEGAVFELKSDAKTYYGKSNANGVVEWFTHNPNDEEFNEDRDKLQGEIAKGTYTFGELSAPTGYVKSEETWTIVFAAPGEISSIISSENPDENMVDKVITGEQQAVFYFDNSLAYDLPSTGGPGIYWYMLGGVLLMMAGSLLVYKKRRGEVLRRK